MTQLVESRAANVRASVTIGDTVFHDGWSWRTHSGPFTLGMATDRNRQSCFVKDVYLPAGDARFAVGASVPIQFSFPRTRQRIQTRLTVTVGHRDGSKVTANEVARVQSLGCTPIPLRQQDIDAGDTVASYIDPYTVSPGSLVKGGSANQ